MDSKLCVQRSARRRPIFGDIYGRKKRPNGNSVQIFDSEKETAPAMEPTMMWLRNTLQKLHLLRPP